MGKRIFAVGLGVLVAVGLFEAAAFVWPAKHALDNPWYTFTGADAQVGSWDLPFERPAHFSWTGMSHGDLAVMNGDRDPHARRVTFRTDHEGFRNGTDLREAEIVFLGDSFTEAGNIPEDETFVQLVGRRTGRSVRNLGRAVYAPPHELVVLEKYGLKCNPRTVVWQIAESNDLAESLILERWIAAGKPYLEYEKSGRPSRREAWKRRSLVHRWLIHRGRGPSWDLTGIFRDADGREHEMRFLEPPAPKHMPQEHPAREIFAGALERGVGLLRQREIEVVLLLIPMKIRVYGAEVEWTDAARAVLPEPWDLPEDGTLAYHTGLYAAQLGARFVDATPELRARAARGELVYQPMDTHLSPLGHEAVAQLIVRALTGE